MRWDEAPTEDQIKAKPMRWDEAPEAPGTLDKIGRQVGLTARAAVTGASSLPAMGADVIGHILNLGIKAYNSQTGSKVPEFQPQMQKLEQNLTAAGLPSPDTTTERVIYKTNQALSGQGAAMAGGAQLAKSGNEVVSGVGKTMSTRPDIQLQAAGGAGASGAFAHDAGWGPLTEFIASLAGGVAVPAGVALARGAPGLIQPFTEKGQRQIAGNVLSDAASSPAEAKTALAASDQIVPDSRPTMAAATRDPGLASLERSLSAKPDGSLIQERYLQNNAARMRELNSMAGSPEDIAAAQSVRATQTAPLRDAALENANMGSSKTATLTERLTQKNQSIVSALQDKGRFSATASEQGALADNFTPTPGQPRLPGRYSANAERVPEAKGAVIDAATVEAQRKAERSFLEYQLNSLEQHGYSPLQVGNITSELGGVMNQPGMRASTVVQKTLKDVHDKLSSLADKNGNIDARDLYTVRKEIGNIIAVHAKDNQNWDKKLTAGLSRDIQGSIDGAIKRAGAGDLWDSYLGKYAELSKPVNQMETLQEVVKRSTGTQEDRLGNRQLLPSAFQKTTSDLDGVAAAATGFGKAKAEDILTPQQLSRLENLRKDLIGAQFAQSGGKVAGSNTVQLANYSTANLIGRIVSGRGDAGPITRNLARGLDWVNKYNDRDIDRLLIEAAKDPALAGTLMKTATRDRIELASDALEKIAKSIGLGTATSQVTQTGKPDQRNQR